MMTHSNFASLRLWFQSSIRRNRTLIVLELLLIPGLLAFSTYRWKEWCYFYNATPCLGDSFALSTTPSVTELVLVVFMLLLSYSFTKNDFAVECVIRQKNKASLFAKQILAEAIHSLLFVLYVTLWQLLWGLAWMPGGMNWHKEGSVYALLNKAVAQHSFLQVFSAFIGVTWLLMLAFSALTIVLKWITDDYLTGWIVSIAILALGITNAGQFLAHTNIRHEIWATPFGILVAFALPLALLIILCIIGFWVAGRRDFLHEKGQ